MAATAGTPSTGPAGKVVYEPGLDGLRAVAVGTIVLFHLHFAWAQGGFLGVPVFFTLSGFLITRLLLAEHQRDGRISLSRFWTRRVRRLVPASMACILGVVVVARWVDPGVPATQLRGDAAAAVANVANWRFMLADQSYAELFVGKPSPLLHFWSLAIEEQFYFVFPLVIAATLWCARRRRWVLPAVLVTLTGASILAALATTDHDVIYYGTHTRAAELLIGALAAVVVARIGVPRRRPAVVAANLAALGAAVLLVTVTLVVAQGDAWLYRGGFAALAVVWVALVVGAMTPGPVRAALSCAPLVLLGRLSYGVYLFHWPVFMYLDASRVPNVWLLTFLRLGVTAALAAVSYRWIEQPVRLGTLPRPGWPSRAAYAGALGISVLAVGSTSVAAPAASEVSTMLAAPTGEAPVVMPSGAAGAEYRAEPARPVPTVPPSLTVAVVGGDSQVAGAAALLDGTMGGDHRLAIEDLTVPGCSMLADPTVASPVPCPLTDPAAAAPTADIVVLAVGDAERQVLDLGGTRVEPISPEMNLRYRSVERGLVELTGRLGERAETVAIVRGDIAPAGLDWLGLMLDSAAASNADTNLLTLADLGASTLAGYVPEAESTRTRVMVIGDSVSYGMAAQLASVAGDRMSVVWAGGQNCPIVDVSQLRWWEGAEWPMDECPNVDQRWPDVVADFDPDIVFVVSSLPEQAEQRYGDDPTWHVAGDPAFTIAHDEAMNRLVALVQPTGARIVVANAPPITSGAFSASSMATPERTEAWNVQLYSWAAQHPDSVSLVDLAGMVVDAEAAAGGSLRVDGVHLTDQALAEIIRTRLANALLAPPAPAPSPAPAA